MKKKVALSATAIAVLASAVPTHVALVQAEETGDIYYVDNTDASSNSDSTGNGTKGNPFKQLYSAIEKAKDGDTIIVTRKGYVNDNWSGQPLVINKKVTIKSLDETPPTISFRTPGIVLGKDVKFENVNLSLYNSSSSYIYANGHKLELINTTFDSTDQVSRNVTLYAGGKSGSDVTGNKGSIIIKTDGGFKGGLINRVVTVGAIYAGGDSGTASIPADIQVHQGANNSISLTNIVGQNSGGSTISSDMSVILSNIAPGVYGGNGLNSLTVGSVYSRDLSISNINSLNISNGTIELSDDAVDSVNNVNIAQGAILDLRGRFSDLTIGTYTGQGGIALGNKDNKVDITSPIQTGNSLEVYLHGYSTQTGYNGWHEKNFTYVTTANSDASVTLYGDNTFSSGYKFIPLQSGDHYEWQVAKPAPVTPDLPEEEEKDPVLTTITATETTQTVNVSSYDTNPAHEVEYLLNVSTNSEDEEEEVWLTDFVDDLVVTVNGRAMVFNEDDSVYYNAEEGVEVYLEPMDGVARSQRVLVSFHDEDGSYNGPTKEEYSIQIGTATIPSVTLTLDVEGLEEKPELPPNPPEGGDGGDDNGDPDGDGESTVITPTTINFTEPTKTVVYGNRINETFEYTLTDEEGQSVTDLSKYPIELYYEGKQLEQIDVDTGKYKVSGDSGLIATVADGTITIESPDGKVVTDPYRLEVKVKDTNISGALTLMVYSPVSKVTFAEPKEETITLQELGEGTLVVEYDLNIELDEEVDNAIDFLDIGYNLKVNDTLLNPLRTQSGDGYYRNNEDTLRVVFEPDGDDPTKQKMIVKFENSFGDPSEVTPGTYKFSLLAEDVESDGATLTIEKPATPTITQFVLVGEDTKVVARDTDKPFFEFRAEGTGDLKALDQIDNFKITINGNTTQKVTQDGDSKVYFKSPTDWVDTYIEYDESTGNHKLHLQPFSNSDSPVYTEDKYTIVLSYGEEIPALTFIANVENGTNISGPSEPDTDEPTVTGFSQGSYSAQEFGTAKQLSTDIKVNFDKEPNEAIEFHNLDGATVIFKGDQAQYNEGKGGYLTADGKYVLSFQTADELGKYAVTLKTVDGSELTVGEYPFTLEVGEEQAELQFKVVALPAEPDPDPAPQPPIEEPDPELPTPDTTEVTYTLPEGQADQEETVTKIAGMLPSHTFFITPQFVPPTPKVSSFLNGLTVTIGGHKAERVGEEYLWIAEGVDVTLGIGPTGDDGYQVSFSPVKPSDGSILDDGQYTATIQYGDSNPVATFKLNVESEQVTPTPPPVDPDPEEPTPTPGDKEKEEEEPTDPPSGGDKEEEVKSPTVDVVIFPQGSTKTVDVSQATLGVELPLNLTLSQTETKVVDFKDLGYSVAINGKTTTLNGADYVLADSNIRVTFTNKGNDVWQAFLFKQGTNGERLPLPVGTYNISAVDENSKDFEFSIVVKDNTPTPPSGGGSSSGGNSGGTSGGNTGGNNGGTSSGGSNTGGSSSGGSAGGNTGGTTLPAPDPKPEKPVEKPPVVDKPTPVPPKQEETKPTTRPTVKPGAIASAVEALEQLSTTIKEKVDSLLTEVVEQAKGLVLDLTGDANDLSSVSTLEVTKDGIFANVDGEKVKFATDLKLNDMSKLRITRTDGSPIPYKTDGTGFTITTHNFSDILITERVVEPFVDVAKDDWFQPYVDEMYNRGITTGTTATSFSPNASITRAQLAALLARTYELKPTGENPVLTDTADQWYAADVQALVDLGIIKGYGDGTFRGDEPITREHLVIMLQRLAEKLGKDANHVKESNFTDTAKMSAEGKSAIQWAAEQGIINSGQGTAFKPKSGATRAQVAKMLTLFINK